MSTKTSQARTDSQKISVILAADDNYAMPLSVTATSILSHLSSDYFLNLFILDGGIKSHNREKIQQSLKFPNYSITWLQPAVNQLKNIKPKGKRISLTACYRLLLLEVLPSSLQKVIYLDTDIIVQTDLARLWNIPLENYDVLAVQDLFLPYVSSPRALYNYQDLGISRDTKYFNSGVLVINLDTWRAKNIGQRVIEYIEDNYEQIFWLDQDGLNAIIAGNWQALDFRWNQMHMVYKYASWKDEQIKKLMEPEIQRLMDEPYIIHFSSSPKPWQNKCQHPKKELFFHYLAKTRWSPWRLKLSHYLEDLQMLMRQSQQRIGTKVKKGIERMIG
ncbi:MAG: glycosyltransferase family 8 protein [Prochlorotrichaceae cyanobacterium]|jgi:lipopolysaccharide biosynthesis glycosyltransferase